MQPRAAASLPRPSPARPGPAGRPAPPLGAGSAEFGQSSFGPTHSAEVPPHSLEATPTPFTEATPLLTLCTLQPPGALLPRKAELKTRKKDRDTAIGTLRLRKGGAGSQGGGGGDSTSVSSFALVFGFSSLPPKMNRFFGKAKPKAPPPSLTDCIGTVGTRPRITRLRDSDIPDPAHPGLPAPTPPFRSWFRTPRPSPPHLHSCYPGSFLTPQTRDS